MLGKSILHARAHAVLVTVHRPDYANEVAKTQKEQRLMGKSIMCWHPT